MTKLSDIENNCTLGESAGWLHDFSKEVQFSACQTILNKIKHFSSKTNELQLFLVSFLFKVLSRKTSLYLDKWMDRRTDGKPR